MVYAFTDMAIIDGPHPGHSLLGERRQISGSQVLLDLR